MDLPAPHKVIKRSFVVGAITVGGILGSNAQQVFSMVAHDGLPLQVWCSKGGLKMLLRHNLYCSIFFIIPSSIIEFSLALKICGS